LCLTTIIIELMCALNDSNWTSASQIGHNHQQQPEKANKLRSWSWRRWSWSWSWRSASCSCKYRCNCEEPQSRLTSQSVRGKRTRHFMLSNFFQLAQKLCSLCPTENRNQNQSIFSFCCIRSIFVTLQLQLVLNVFKIIIHKS